MGVRGSAVKWLLWLMFKRRSPVCAFHDLEVVIPAFANSHSFIVIVFEDFLKCYIEHLEHGFESFKSLYM